MTVKRWLGSAVSVKDVWTVSLSGTVISQTYSITINGKSISYVAGGADTVSIILTALITAWGTCGIPEFQELTATGVGSVGSYTAITLTQNVSGRPSVITVATGGGATFSIANTVAATGPNFFDNSQNWSGGVAPANSDTLVFDNGSVPCNYNISTSLTGVTLEVNPGYAGKIGLPILNMTGSTPYAEYRTTFLTLAGGTAVINSTQISQCNIAFGSNTTTIRVLSTGTQRLINNTPILLINGGNSSSNLYITKGDVATAFYQGQTATFDSIVTSYATTPGTDVSLVIGVGTTLTTLTKNGGNVTLSSNCTTASQQPAGGTLTITDSAAITTVNCYGGTLSLNSVGTIGTVNLYGSAILTCDGDPRAKTITTLNVYTAGVTVTDNQRTINSGTLTINASGITGITVNHGPITTVTYV